MNADEPRQTDIIVRWNGTANTEWGRYLEAQPDPVRPAPNLRPPRPTTLVARVLHLIHDRALTRAEVAQELGVTVQQAAGALKQLVADRLVIAHRVERRYSFGPPTTAATYRASTMR